MVNIKETKDAVEIMIERQLSEKEYKRFKKQLNRMIGKSFMGRVDLCAFRLIYWWKKVVRQVK